MSGFLLEALLESAPDCVVVLLQLWRAKRKPGRPEHVARSSAALAFSKVGRSGPCGCRLLWIDTPPGRKPSAFDSYAPCTSPMSSLITLRWNQGGRKLCSATCQRGGKITKSQLATPGCPEGEVSTVKMDGSEWSKVTVLTAMKRARSYLQGVPLPCHATTSSGEWRASVAHKLPRNLSTSSHLPRSSYAATGAWKSRFCARPCEPIGPSSGRRKWAP